jgi:hypothetical protein
MASAWPLTDEACSFKLFTLIQIYLIKFLHALFCEEWKKPSRSVKSNQIKPHKDTKLN